MDPVLDALKDAINQRRLNVDELWRQAQAQRMQQVMTPYLGTPEKPRSTAAQLVSAIKTR